jgi:hypothetical protein
MDPTFYLFLLQLPWGNPSPGLEEEFDFRVEMHQSWMFIHIHLHHTSYCIICSYVFGNCELDDEKMTPKAERISASALQEYASCDRRVDRIILPILLSWLVEQLL